MACKAKRDGINWMPMASGWCYDSIGVFGYSRDELTKFRGDPKNAEEQVLDDLGDFGTALKCGYGVYNILFVVDVPDGEQPYIILKVGKSCD